MELSTVQIKNYRSYKDSGDIVLDDRTIVVGENNAGKSNMLRALEMALNLSPTKPHSVEDSYGHEGEDIRIELTFDSLTSEERNELEPYLNDGELWFAIEFPFKESVSAIGSDIEPDRKRYITSREKFQEPELENLRSGSATDVKAAYERVSDNFPELFEAFEEHKVEDWEGKHKKYITSTAEQLLESGDVPTKFEDVVDPTGIKKQLDQYVPEIYYLPASRSIDDHARASTRSFLGKLLSGAIESTDSEVKQKISQSLSDIRSQLNDENKFDEIESLERELCTNLSDQIPVNDISIEIDVPELNDILSNVRVTVDDGVETDIEDMGTGMHSSFILACLREVAKLDSDAPVILALEEPENDLHPHAQRQLFDTLGELSESQHQVIMSTHSPRLVTADDLPHVRRVEKINQESEVFSSRPALKELPTSQINSVKKLITLENGELFFSKLLLIGEGETEESILPIFNPLYDDLKTDHYRFDRIGVTLVPAGGKAGMKPFLRLADAFNLDSLALIDDDSDHDDGHNNLRKELERMSTELRELPKDMEHELFNAISYEQFCGGMQHATNGKFDKTPEDMEAKQCGKEITQLELMSEEFDDFEPSKPKFGEYIAKSLTAEDIPEEIQDLMNQCKRMASSDDSE